MGDYCHTLLWQVKLCRVGITVASKDMWELLVHIVVTGKDMWGVGGELHIVVTGKDMWGVGGGTTHYCDR